MRQPHRGWQLRVLTLLIVIVGCDEKDAEVDDETEDGSGTSQLVFPLLPSYRNWDYHFAQWLTGHPVYEMAELMVEGLETDAPEVWVFFTEAEAPKDQVHYVNCESLATYLGEGSDTPSSRAIHVLPISFEMVTDENGAPGFDVSFEDETGTPVSWSYRTISEPTSEYADMLIPQSGHDLVGGILVMYVSLSTLSSETTVLRIGEEEYPIGEWEEHSVKPHFTAYHGFCSKELSHGYLSAGTVAYETVAAPERIEEDATWRMRFRVTADDEWTPFDYTVTRMTNDRFEAESGPFFVEATVSENRVGLLQLKYQADGGYIAVRFKPELPDLEKMAAGVSVDSAFAVDIDDHIDQITGVATATRTEQTVDLLLAPEYPDWAATNQMRVTLRFADDGYATAIETIQLD